MSDDLIKRSDAIEALNECTDIKGFEYTQMHNALIDIPSADRPQGEWINARDGVSDHVKCTNCFRTYYLGIVENYNFCPNCGARMKGADDE